MTMQWALEFTRRFKKAYKKLDKIRQEQVNEAIRQLANSNVPETLGIKKKGPLRSVYAYELGLGCRILYQVDHNERVIFFLRVCHHKEVYGP